MFRNFIWRGIFGSALCRALILMVFATAAFGVDGPIESFGARGDLAFRRDGRMTASSQVLNSSTGGFSSGDIGKPIIVNGAGMAGTPLIARITAVRSSQQVALDIPASTAVTGAIFYFGTDDTAAFQSAIDRSVAENGGVINLGKKNYLITRTLIIPKRLIGRNQVAVVEFRGAIAPVRSNWNNVDGVIGGQHDVVLPVEGQTILQTSQMSGAMIQVDPTWGEGTPRGNPTGVQMGFHNMVFRVPARSATTGLDLRKAYSLRMIDVTVEPSDHQSNLPRPVGGGTGIDLPGSGNGAQVVLRRVGVAGFEIGIRHYEHADLDDIWIYRCTNAIICFGDNHAPRWGRIQIIWCPYGIVSSNRMPATTAEHIGDGALLDFEDAPAGHWAQPVSHIFDPGNNLRGNVIYHRVVPFVGPEDGILVNGARNLLRRQHGSPNFDPSGVSVGGTGDDPLTGNLLARPERVTRLRLMGAGARLDIRDGVRFGAGNAEAIASLESPAEDHQVTTNITISPGRSAAGLCIKCSSPNNYIAAILEIQSGFNRVRLFKRENGTYADLGTAMDGGLSPGRAYRLTTAVRGGNITVSVDGVQRIQYQLTPAETARFGQVRRFGIYAFMSGTAEDGGSRWSSLELAQP